jgi:hypothetical protein
MNDFRLSPLAIKKTSNPIIIIGATRSGTTILENIVSSFKNIECFDEPALFRVLLCLYDTIDKKDFELLCKTYFFEERLINSVSGRNINLNKKDQTSIFRSKSKSEIYKRLNKSHPRIEILKRINNFKIALKLVDLGPNILKLDQIFKKSQFILIIRNPKDTINSILKKNWYKLAQLKSKEGLSGKWLFKEKYKNFNLPFWLKDSQINNFMKMKEIDRCATYYINEYKNIIKFIKKIKNKNLSIIDYDKLINKPSKTIDYIIKKTASIKTKKTQELMKKIKFKKKESLIKNINLNLYKECNKLYLTCDKLSFKD